MAMYDWDEFAIVYTTVDGGREVTAYTEPRRARRELAADRRTARAEQLTRGLPDDTGVVMRHVSLGVSAWQAIQ
jgi:hypothetical protein